MRMSLGFFCYKKIIYDLKKKHHLVIRVVCKITKGLDLLIG